MTLSKHKTLSPNLSASDQLVSKKEKVMKCFVASLIANKKNSQNIRISDNKITNVSSYATYLSLTKPKHTSYFEREIINAHNLLKVWNPNGKLNSITF